MLFPIQSFKLLLYTYTACARPTAKKGFRMYNLQQIVGSPNSNHLKQIVINKPYANNFLPRTVLQWILRIRRQNTNRAVPLDAVPERRTKRCSPRFRPGHCFCELSLRYQSPGREEEKFWSPRPCVTDPFHPLSSIPSY